MLSTVTSADSSENRSPLAYRFLSDAQHNIFLQTSKPQLHFHASMTLYSYFFIHKDPQLAAGICTVTMFLVETPSDRYANVIIIIS